MSPVMQTAFTALKAKFSSQIDKNKLNNRTMKRQTPLINRFYYYRNELVKKAFSTSYNFLYNTYNSIFPKILILGAGLDTTIEKTYKNNTNIYLVDFPQVLAQREGRNESNSNINYIPCDLTDIEGLDKALCLSSFYHDQDKDGGYIILMESVLAYMKTNEQECLLKYVSRKITSPCISITFDPLLPIESEGKEKYQDNGFGLTARQIFANLDVPLYCVASPLEQMCFFKRNGFAHTSCLTMLEMIACHSGGKNDSSNVNEMECPPHLKSEPFDEFHELVLAERHYGITISTNTTLANIGDKETSETHLALMNRIIDYDAHPHPNKDKDKDQKEGEEEGEGRRCVIKVRESEAPDFETILKQRQEVIVHEVQKLLHFRFVSFNQEVTGEDEEIEIDVGLSIKDIVKLDRATTSDVDAICGLLTKGYSDLTPRFPSVRKQLKNTRHLIGKNYLNARNNSNHDDTILLVARADNYFNKSTANKSRDVIGCVGLKKMEKIDDQVMFQISYMAVSPRWRRRGVARMLLENVLLVSEDMCKSEFESSLSGSSMTFRRLYNLTVVEDLKAACRLYASFGFMQMKREELPDGCVICHYQLSKK